MNPKLEDVIKKTATKEIATKDVIDTKGIFLSIWKIANDLSEIPFASAPVSVITWSKAVSPKVLIQIAVTIIGTKSTAIINSLTVLLFDTLAINIPTNGDHVIHQAQ